MRKKCEKVRNVMRKSKFASHRIALLQQKKNRIFSLFRIALPSLGEANVEELK
jgi:hypothetical protein